MPAKSSRDSVEALLSDLDSLGTDAAIAPPRSSSASSSSKRTSARAQPSHIQGANDDAQSLLDDLDNLVQRRAATPKRVAELTQGSPRTATAPDPAGAAATTAAPEAATAATPAGAQVTRSPSPPTKEGDSVAAHAASKLEASPRPEQQQQEEAAVSQSSVAASSSGGWNSWGSVWSTASKLADQARAEIEKRAQSEQAKEITNRGWGLAQNVRGFVKEAGLEKLGESDRCIIPRGSSRA